MQRHNSCGGSRPRLSAERRDAAPRTLWMSYLSRGLQREPPLSEAELHLQFLHERQMPLNRSDTSKNLKSGPNTS